MTLIERIHRVAERFVSGESIWERGDWDICCLLDGCRVDALEATIGNVDSYRSVASTSPTWVERTFANAPDGVAYVSANPFSPPAEDAVRHLEMVPVREVSGVETAPPQDVTTRAVDVWQHREELGIDRLVVHYMQPHVPFRSRPEWFQNLDRWGSHRWQDIDDDIDRDEWLVAYRDNLAWALVDGVGQLASAVDATIAVTADHGNATGEWGLWGHPRGGLAPSVRRVPWTTIDGVVAEPIEVGEKGDYDAESQLEALGYA